MGDGELTGISRRMDEHLAPGVVKQVLDSCGCLGNAVYHKIVG